MKQRLHGLGGVAAFALVIALFITAELWIGARAASIQLFAFAALVAVTQTAAGLMALRAGAMQHMKARLPAAFCVGFVCITLPVYAVSSLFDMSALWAFVACAAVVLMLVLALPSHIARRTVTSEPQVSLDIAVALVFAVAIVVLTRASVASARVLEVTDALPLWSDYFLHGVTISSFGGPFAGAFGRGTDMEVLGIGRVFYHYATFMLPAAFQPLAGATGLALATSMLLPLGLLTAALGSYAFVTQLGGRAVGLLAVAVAFVVPLYRVPLHSGMLDFHWMFLATPGAGYAIGLAMVACLAAVHYVEHGGARPFWFLALLVLSIILVRAHFFMLIAPALAMYVGLRRDWPYRNTALVGFGLAVLAMAIAWTFPAVRQWYAAEPPGSYLNTVLAQTLLFGQPLVDRAYPAGLMILAKTGLTLVALLGVYVLVYPVLLVVNTLRSGLRGADRIALFMLLTYVGLMLFAPTASNGDATEYKHRHFPLAYVVVALLSVLHACRLLGVASANVEASAFASSWPRRAPAALAILVLGAAMLITRGENPARPDVEAMPWTKDFYGQRVPPGLVDAAQFMRSRSAPGDMLAIGGEAATGFSRTIVDLISITDIPAFLARAELRMLRAPCVQRTVTLRTAALKNIAAAKDWPEARQRLRDNAIRWLLVPAGESAAWDSSRQAAAFTSNDLSVYDAGTPAPGVTPPTERCN